MAEQDTTGTGGEDVADPALLVTALEAVPHGVLVSDHDGTILWTNTAFRLLSGYDRDDLVGANPRLLNSGTHDEAFYRDLWETILDGRVWRGTIVERHRDGHTYPVRQTITPLLGPTGDVEHFVAVHEDITEHQLATQTLHRTSAQIQLLLTHLPIHVWTVDEALVPSSVVAEHPEAGSPWGSQVPVDILVGPPTDPDHAGRQAHLDALAGHAGGFEFHWDDRWWRAATRPLHDDQGQAVGAVGVAVDVTDAQRTVRELDESRARMQALFSAALDAIALADDDGHYLDVNPAMEALTGYRRDDLLTMTVPDLAAADGPIDVVADQFEKFTAAGATEGHFVIRRADGELRETEYRAVANILPGVHLSVMRDVTERYRTMRRLVASEAEFRQLADQATDIVARLDVDADDRTEVTYVNPAVEPILGFRTDRFRTEPDLAPALLALSNTHRSRPLVPGEHTSWTVPARHATGRRVWLECHTTCVGERDGRRTFQVLARDVTNRHETEEALLAAVRDQQAAAKQLRAVTAMKDALLNNVSHELRTPLTAILGFASTLTQHGDQIPATQATRFHERILVQARRLQDLLDDLVLVDRLGEEDATAPPHPTMDLGPVVRRAVDQSDLGDRAVTLDLPHALVPANEEHVGRAVGKLLDNVVRHAPDATHVHVALEPAPGEVRLTVEDDGPGLPQGVVDDLFAPFRQGDAATHAASPGIGLGLAYVATVATLHGGAAHAERRASGGTRVVMILPTGT